LLNAIFQDDNIQAISNISGTKISQAKEVINISLPELFNSLSKNNETQEGEKAFFDTLDKHNGSVLNNIIGTINNNETRIDGAKILVHIFGEKESEIIKNIVLKTGVTDDQAKTILQTTAPLVLESLGKAKLDNGLSASGITKVLKEYFGKKGGNTIVGSLFDKDRDGDIKDDLLTMFINWIKGFFLKK